MEKVSKRNTLIIRSHFKSQTQEEVCIALSKTIANLINRNQEDGIEKKGDTIDE